MVTWKLADTNRSRAWFQEDWDKSSKWQKSEVCAVVKVREDTETARNRRGFWGTGTGSGGKVPNLEKRFPVVMAKGFHLFPSRTQKLSPSAPMVLGWTRPGRVGRRRIPMKPLAFASGFFVAIQLLMAYNPLLLFFVKCWGTLDSQRVVKRFAILKDLLSSAQKLIIVWIKDNVAWNTKGGKNTGQHLFSELHTGWVILSGDWKRLSKHEIT